MLEAAGKDSISDCSCGSYPGKYPKPWVYDCARDPHPDWPSLEMNTGVCLQGNKSLVCVLVCACVSTDEHRHVYVCSSQRLTYLPQLCSVLF